MGGTFDFRVTPNPNFMLDVNFDVEFDNSSFHFKTHNEYNPHVMKCLGLFI